MTKQELEIEELFQKAFKALDAKIKDENSIDEPSIYLDKITDILLEQQIKEWEAKH